MYIYLYISIFMLNTASHSRLTRHQQFTDENILTLRHSHSLLYLAHFGPDLMIVTTSLENVITLGVIDIDSWLGLTICPFTGRAPSDVCQAVSIMGSVTVTTGDHWRPGVISPSHVTVPARTQLLRQKLSPIPRAGPHPLCMRGPLLVTGH